MNVDNVLILNNEMLIRFGQYRLMNGHKSNDIANVSEYAALVGAKCSQRIALYKD